MKKSLIALAIVAALPVAAQADATISGSVESVYAQGGTIDTDAELNIDVEEVLENGMIATVSIDILASDGTNQGTAGLKGDFGTFTAGSLDSDGAFQHGDAGDIVGDTETIDSSGTTVHGVNYTSGDMFGFGLAIQVNGNTGPSGTVAVIDPINYIPARSSEIQSSQAALTYDVGNGLKVGYAMATADADNLVTVGVNNKTNVFGGTYTMDDLEFTLGKQKDKGAKASVQYVNAAFTTKLSFQQSKGTSPSVNTVEVGYVQNGINASVKKTKNVKAEWDLAYATGDLTFEAANTKKYTATLGYGNADITLKRDLSSPAGKTSLGYKVSF